MHMHILSAKNGSSEHPEADLCGMGGDGPALQIWLEVSRLALEVGTLFNALVGFMSVRT